VETRPFFHLEEYLKVHDEHVSEAIDPLVADGLIEDLLYPVKSGKEGTLYCCRANPSLGTDLVAVKVYKPQRFRSFRDDSMYREGRVILDRRAARAAAKSTGFGRETRSALWTNSEFSALQVLHRAGADVPKPIASTGGAIVMEWIGDDESPAPQLKDVDLPSDEAHDLFERLLANVELWLACNIVHGDLSAYNLLYDAGRLVAIDFPQASDPRFNANAGSLLARDLHNVARYFRRWGVHSDPNALADDLWDRFTQGKL
jgi:RIO kinase 1